MATPRILRKGIAVIVFGACLVAPVAASAVTVDQIVQLSKAGVSEAVILALLDRDRTVLTIDPDQLIALKREGLSDNLIMAMLKNGRDEAEAAANAVAALNEATILSDLAATPGLVVVGHGPDEPFGRTSTQYFGPYVAPYVLFSSRSHRRAWQLPRTDEPSSSIGVPLPSISGSLPSISGLPPVERPSRKTRR